MTTSSKRNISSDTSETAKKSALKQPPKTVPTRNFFAPLKTNGVNTETAGAENTLQETEASRKSGRPPPLVMTSTTNLIQIQIHLKEHVKEEYEIRNTRNGNTTTKTSALSGPTASNPHDVCEVVVLNYIGNAPKR
jgi:hypothetical protein